MAERRKLIVVGDGNCGKTLMLSVYQNKEVLNVEHKPTVFEAYVHNTEVDGVTVELELCDTAGQEGYDRLRLIAYKHTSVVVLVYSVSEPASFDNIVHWTKEIKTKVPTCPIILVGNKTDLREDAVAKESLKRRNLEPVQEMDGRRMKDKIKAVEFLECSALYNVGVHEVFETAVRVTLTPKDVVNSKGSFWSNCVLM